MSESRVLAIGDIHGAIGPLQRLLRRLQPCREDTLIFLGDYIDRGEDSRAVLEYLIDLESRYRCVFLKGNHEDMFLSSCDGDPSARLLWLENGGWKTVRDFGGPLPARRLLDWLPPARHMAWLQRLRMSYETESHYFVHAGLRPGAPPDATTDHERLWIREPFLSSDYDWGKRVVFGHTMQIGGPLIQPNKIGIDTGACAPWLGGRLTALVLPAGRFVASRGRITVRV
jgi:diadenosine tetraphosphatase ApaH/serine/threonine PP2A family protein phosphatase